MTSVDVPIWRRAGFRSKEAAADHQRAKNKWKRAQRESAKALVEGERAARSWEVAPEPSTPAQTKPLAPPKVARLVPPPPPLQLHVDQSTLRSREEAERASLDFEADRARGRQMILEKGRQSIGG